MNEPEFGIKECMDGMRWDIPRFYIVQMGAAPKVEKLRVGIQAGTVLDASFDLDLELEMPRVKVLRRELQHALQLIDATIKGASHV